jgi:catechol 2,3-dioxygenase-like lactoylglutathione lyase family enzyme
MLGDNDAIAMIAVTDVKAATALYEGVLGLTPSSTEGDEVITYRSGKTALNVYHSEYAATNKATSVVWNVGDEIEAVVAVLKSKGVTFERYDMPGLTPQGDLYVGGGMKVAWFKDPDGNILSVVSG